MVAAAVGPPPPTPPLSGSINMLRPSSGLVAYVVLAPLELLPPEGTCWTNLALQLLTIITLLIGYPTSDALTTVIAVGGGGGGGGGGGCGATWCTFSYPPEG